MKKKSTKQPTLAIPYPEIFSELTNEEVSMILGGKAKATQTIISNRTINGCLYSGILKRVNGKIIKNSMKTNCKDKANIPSIRQDFSFDTDFPFGNINKLDKPRLL